VRSARIAFRPPAVAATDNGLRAPGRAAGIAGVKSAKPIRRALTQLAVAQTSVGAPERTRHHDHQAAARPRHHRRAARLRPAPFRGAGGRRWALFGRIHAGGDGRRTPALWV